MSVVARVREKPAQSGARTGADRHPSRILEAAKIVETVARLRERIAEQFPGSGLAGLCGSVYDVAEVTAARATELARPYWGLRGLAFALVAAGLGAEIYFGVLLGWGTIIARPRPAETAQGLNAVVNLALLAFGGFWFVLTLETRLKRRRTFANLYEFRSLAHIVDMHQLTKDPNDGRLGLSEPRLARYLDYCTQMLALIGKLAALYAEHTQDREVADAVNEIEELTTGLGRKIWQKIMTLSRLEEYGRTPAP